MDLFEHQSQPQALSRMPLARRMRPESLDDYTGQRHIIGEGKLLRKAVKADKIASLILYGPPGCGKTALASCIAEETKSHFSRLNAVTSGVPDLRKLIEEAKNRVKTSGKRTIVFIDEIHRFNKQQQDALMPDVEDGNIILIGATVMNPFFSINPPLLSRSMIFELKPLEKEDVKKILRRASEDRERGLGSLELKIHDEALDYIADRSGGDARRALNALETGALTLPEGAEFTLDQAEEAMRGRTLRYDRAGDEHYDTISAFIKSMRGSDPDAAVYWLAKMLSAGEDPLFIARRIAICASEDVGNADPMAIVVANAALGVVELIGLPEARITLSQAAIYVAAAPKSNASYKAINSAMADVADKEILPVPEHLKDSSYKGSKRLGRGEGYKYPHDFPGHYVEQEYAPGIKGKYYRPSSEGFEKKIKERMDERKRNPQKKNS